MKKEHNPRKIEELITHLLLGASFIRYTYVGAAIFILEFETPGHDRKIVSLKAFSNINLKELATIPNDNDEPLQEYLDSCSALYEVYGFVVKGVNILPDNSLVIKLDDIRLHVNSLHAPKYSILDRSWIISAKQGEEFIDIICDGKEELVANISKFPIV